MNVTKRKKTIESPSSSSQVPLIKKKIAKSKDAKQPNLLYPIIPIVVSSCLFAYVYLVLLREENLIPFHNVNSPLLASAEADARKWGTLRSGHYFGLKTLARRSLVFGLMWFENRVIENNVRIRHWCDQSDNLNKYGWLKHDFHSFGIQEILDGDLNITTSFVTAMGDDSQSSGWRARVSVDFNDKIKSQLKAQERRMNSSRIKIKKEFSLLPYFALDSLDDSEEQLWVEKDTTAVTDQLTEFQFRGKTSVFTNGFRGRAIVPNHDLIFSSGLNDTIDPPLLHIKENAMQNLFLTDYPGEEADKNKYLIILRDNLRNRKVHKPKKTNLALRQLIVKVPSVIDFEFEELNATRQPIQLFGDDFTRLLEQREQAFDREFARKFKLSEKGYSRELIQFAKSALSNMLGSVGSFSGFSQVSLIEESKLAAKNEKRKVHKYGPLKLLTSVPSRSFFPRGFLWDEGFHQLLLSKYDRNLSESILSSWFDLMNRNGWIPREVILGVEAEERVPNEFIVQNVHVANPPTFYLLVDSLLNSLNEDEFNSNRLYFSGLYDRLQVWFDWFNRTQIGTRPGSYRWRGRDESIRTELNVKTLSSGFDDYPRASSPTDNELHVDLLSWMMYATRTMERLSGLLDHSSNERFKQYSAWLTNRHLDELHWSEEHQMYCDIGLHSKRVVLRSLRASNQAAPISVRKELEPAQYDCVDEFGYVSLFPMLLQLIEPTNRRLGVLLTKLRDPNLLWSAYGLRSLSRNSSYYNARNTEHDPPYWRGAVWTNINYLALKSLAHYSTAQGPHRALAGSIYGELKTNLINNMYNEYKNRNYFYENYDDKTGQGKGCYPFTGWTALVALMMSENYS